MRYLNRLSDLLFILSRGANGGDEPLWEPGAGAEQLAPQHQHDSRWPAPSPPPRWPSADDERLVQPRVAHDLVGPREHHQQSQQAALRPGSEPGGPSVSRSDSLAGSSPAPGLPRRESAMNTAATPSSVQVAAMRKPPTTSLG